MGTITIDDWTGALVGADGTDYRLVAAGDRVTVPYNRYTSDANTVGLWRADEASWNGTPNEIVDSGPSGRHGTAVNGLTTAAGWMNNCAYHDRAGAGVAQYWETAASAAYDLTQFTIEGWIKPTGTNAFYPWYWLHYASNLGWYVYEYADTHTLWIACGNGSTSFRRLGITLTEGVWQHVAIVARGTGTKFLCYVNGVESESIDAQKAIGAAPTVPFRSGGNVQGYIDETRLSNVMRAAGDLKTTRQSTGSLRTAAASVDSGTAGAVWQSVNVTIAAPTSDESYSVYMAPSDTITVPDVTDPAWTLIGSGLTASTNIDVSGLGLANGQYGHLRKVPGVSSDAIHQYAIEFDAVALTFVPPPVAYIPRRVVHARLGPRLLPIGVI